MSRRRGDISIILAAIFAAVTVVAILTQQMMTGQKLKMLAQMSKRVGERSLNEIGAWRLVYRNKAGLNLNTPISGTVRENSVPPTTGVTYVFNSGDGTSTSAIPGIAGPKGIPVSSSKFCSGLVCVGNKESKTHSLWVQQAYVKAVNAGANENFGYRVALKNDTMVVAANFDTSDYRSIVNGSTAAGTKTGNAYGGVYVYKRTGNSWSQEAYIKAPNADLRDNLGDSLALDQDVLAVGCRMEASNQNTISDFITAGASLDNSMSAAGAVYVFRKIGGTWSRNAYIKAANNASGIAFGTSLSLSGNTLVVGADSESANQNTITNANTAPVSAGASQSGAVYVYTYNGTVWTQQAYIKPANNAANNLFGVAVSLDGDTLAVGSGGMQTVYVYRRTGTTWAQEAALTAVNADAGDRYGQSLSLSGDTLAVGANSESSGQNTVTNGPGASADNSVSGAGAVYIYRRNGTVWTQEAYLKAPNPIALGNFGETVSLHLDSLAVGSPGDRSNQATITNGVGASSDTSLNGSGAAYVFKRDGTTWTQESYIKASNVGAGDAFGRYLSFFGDSLSVGAVFEDSAQNFITNGSFSPADNQLRESGAAYVFKRN